jgi:hypothetical protein
MSAFKMAQQFGVVVTLPCMLGTAGSNLGVALAVKAEMVVISLSETTKTRG